MFLIFLFLVCLPRFDTSVSFVDFLPGLAVCEDRWILSDRNHVFLFFSHYLIKFPTFSTFQYPVFKRCRIQRKRYLPAPPLFGNCQGIILIHFRERCIVINGKYYVSLLHRLRNEIIQCEVANCIISMITLWRIQLSLLI